jgi:hypothetical protein
VVFEEVAGPFGIPDFLAVTGSPTLLQRRIKSGFPPLLNEIDAGIVAHLTAVRGKPLGTLVKGLGWKSSTIERRLRGLLRSGVVRDIGDGRLVRHESIVPVGRLHAIETKVRDFRRALRQARTYALWCENYVIVMSEMSDAARVAAVDAVTADCGGLVVGGKWVRLKWCNASSSAMFVAQAALSLVTSSSFSWWVWWSSMFTALSSDMLSAER